MGVTEVRKQILNISMSLYMCLHKITILKNYPMHFTFSKNLINSEAGQIASVVKVLSPGA